MSINEKSDAGKLCYWAAILFLLANLTGLLLIAINNDIIMADKRQMFNSHLNGLLGCFWLLGLAFSLRWVNMGGIANKLLVYTAAIAAYALWLLSLLKSILNVEGTTMGASAENDAIVIGYMILVVIPTLISACLWVTGLRSGIKAS